MWASIGLGLLGLVWLIESPMLNGLSRLGREPATPAVTSNLEEA
jgi:hypothetical protein